MLGGHNFVPTLTIPAPFIDSQTNLLVAGGYGDFPSGPLGLTDSLKLGGVEPLVNIQVAATSWLAVLLGLHSTMIAGVNPQSVAIYGASLQSAFSIGGLGKLLETENLILSLGLIVEFPNYQSLSPLSNLPNYNKFVGLITPDFLYPSVSTVWKPGLRFAYAFNPTFGFTALLGARVLALNQEVQGQATSNLNAGIGFSADLKPPTGVPISLSANYTRNQLIQTEGANGDLYTFGLYETYWTQVAFGLELGFGNTLGNNTTVGGVTARVYY